MTPQYFVEFDSPVGWIGLGSSETGLQRLWLGYDQPGRIQTSSSAPLPRLVSTRLSRARRLLEDYFEGQPVDLSEIVLDIPAGTPFQQRVRRRLQQVGYGNTISYAGLASLAGAPGAARAVGNLMARNPVPLVIPCHRVVGAQGRLGGFSAPQGLSLKRRLLELEGATVPSAGNRFQGALVGSR